MLNIPSKAFDQVIACPRLEPLQGLEPYNMESGTDLCHPSDIRLLATALYPTQRRTPKGLEAQGCLPFCIMAGFEIE
jgi:hypothetical protein